MNAPGRYTKEMICIDLETISVQPTVLSWLEIVYSTRFVEPGRNGVGCGHLTTAVGEIPTWPNDPCLALAKILVGSNMAERSDGMRRGTGSSVP
jgi:hypothetical protein